MAYANGSGAARRTDWKPRNAVMATGMSRLRLAAALLAAGVLGAAESVPSAAHTVVPISAVTPVAAPAPASAMFAGQSYQVVDEYYVDDQGTYWKPLVVTTTAYSPTTEQCDDTPGETATGTDARRVYGVAADPRAVPYGTVLRIPGYGDAPVDDTGGDMRRNWKRGIVHLDLRIPLRRYDGQWRSEDEATRVALEHGVRRDRIVLMKVTMPVTAAR